MEELEVEEGEEVEEVEEGEEEKQAWDFLGFFGQNLKLKFCPKHITLGCVGFHSCDIILGSSSWFGHQLSMDACQVLSNDVESGFYLYIFSQLFCENIK